MSGIKNNHAQMATAQYDEDTDNSFADNRAPKLIDSAGPRKRTGKRDPDDVELSYDLNPDHEMQRPESTSDTELVSNSPDSEKTLLRKKNVSCSFPRHSIL